MSTFMWFTFVVIMAMGMGLGVGTLLVGHYSAKRAWRDEFMGK